MLRPALFAGIMILAVGAAVAGFVQKISDQPDHLDEIKRALAELKQSVPRTNRMGCIALTGGSETTNKVCNAMVPAIVAPEVSTLDTTLFVFQQHAPDSLVNASIAGSRKLWETRSDHYYFILTRKGAK